MPSSPPKKNTAFAFYVGLVSQANTKILRVSPTLAAGDVKVAIDDGAPNNLATLPVVDADFTKRVKVALSAAEMNGDRITIIFSDAAGAEWCDLIIDIATSVRQVDDLASQASLDTLDDYVDTEVAAIKAKTDQLVFTGANKVDAAILAAGDFAQGAADKVWSTATRALTDKVGFALSAAGIQAIWDQLTSGLTAAGSIGKKLADWVLGSDSKVLLSNNAHTGAVIPTVTTVSGDVSLASADEDAIVNKVWDEAIADHLGAGSTGAALNGAGSAGDPWTTALPGAYGAGTAGNILGNRLDAAMTSRAAPGDLMGLNAAGLAADAVTEIQSGLATAAALTTAQADLDDVQTRLPAALVGGRMSSDAIAISGSAPAADKLELGALAMDTGAAVTGTLSTTEMTTDLTEATDDHYNGRTLLWTSGPLLRQATAITDYVGASKKLVFTAVTEAPVAGDTFIIV
jgi:hypothetical protein